MKFCNKPILLNSPLIPDDDGDLTGQSGVGEGDFGANPTEIGNTGGNSGGISEDPTDPEVPGATDF